MRHLLSRHKSRPSNWRAFLHPETISRAGMPSVAFYSSYLIRQRRSSSLIFRDARRFRYRSRYQTTATMTRPKIARGRRPRIVPRVATAIAMRYRQAMQLRQNMDSLIGLPLTKSATELHSIPSSGFWGLRLFEHRLRRQLLAATITTFATRR